MQNIAHILMFLLLLLPTVAFSQGSDYVENEKKEVLNRHLFSIGYSLGFPTGDYKDFIDNSNGITLNYTGRLNNALSIIIDFDFNQYEYDDFKDDYLTTRVMLSLSHVFNATGAIKIEPFLAAGIGAKIGSVEYVYVYSYFYTTETIDVSGFSGSFAGGVRAFFTDNFFLEFSGVYDIAPNVSNSSYTNAELDVSGYNLHFKLGFAF